MLRPWYFRLTGGWASSNPIKKNNLSKKIQKNEKINTKVHFAQYKITLLFEHRVQHFLRLERGMHNECVPYNLMIFSASVV